MLTSYIFKNTTLAQLKKSQDTSTLIVTKRELEVQPFLMALDYTHIFPNLTTVTRVHKLPTHLLTFAFCIRQVAIIVVKVPLGFAVGREMGYRILQIFTASHLQSRIVMHHRA
jgi:hypothetical protein